MVSGLRRAIVHIGLPRTGTTTFQRVLHDIRAPLQSAGILYPELTPRSGVDLHLSHQYFGEALDGRRPRHERAELLAALAGQLSATPCDTVLLSYEGLCVASPHLGIPRRLATLLRAHGFAMEVLVTVKPQDELVNSAYTWRTQFLREARAFAPYFTAEIAQGRLDLARLTRPWRRAADGRVMAVPTLDPSSGLPLVERILAALGLTERVVPLIDPEYRTLVQNRSPGPVAVAVLRQLRLGGAHLAYRGPLRDVSRFVEEAATGRGLDRSPFQGLDAAMRARAASRWASANDAFAMATWGEAWQARVGARPAGPVNEITTLDEVAGDIMREACDRFGLRLRSGWRLRLRDAVDATGARLDRLWRYGRALAS